jgi:hypothetical protein
VWPQSAALRGSGIRFIFIENICNDPGILQQNYFNKMMYSPDYKGIPTEKVRYNCMGATVIPSSSRVIYQMGASVFGLGCYGPYCGDCKDVQPRLKGIQTERVRYTRDMGAGVVGC